MWHKSQRVRWEMKRRLLQLAEKKKAVEKAAKEAEAVAAAKAARLCKAREIARGVRAGELYLQLRKDGAYGVTTRKKDGEWEVLEHLPYEIVYSLRPFGWRREVAEALRRLRSGTVLMARSYR